MPRYEKASALNYLIKNRAGKNQPCNLTHTGAINIPAF
jgi:hypothetical protein